MMSDKCWGCDFYQKPYDGNNSLEGYEEPSPPMCLQPNLIELADESENAAVLIERILFTLSELNNCPFRVRTAPARAVRSILDLKPKKQEER
jgi:hypothetical protein